MQKVASLHLKNNSYESTSKSKPIETTAEHAQYHRRHYRGHHGTSADLNTPMHLQKPSFMSLERWGKYNCIRPQTQDVRDMTWYAQHQSIIHAYEYSYAIRSYFSADSGGTLIQWDSIAPRGQGFKEWGKVQDFAIWAIDITKNGQYLFTTDKKGYMKQWSTRDQSLVRDYGKIHENCIFAIMSTYDSCSLFTSDNKGYLRKFSIGARILLKGFRTKSESVVDTMVVCQKDKFLFTASRFGSIEKFDCVSCKSRKAFVIEVCRNESLKILSMKITLDNKHLIVSDCGGNLYWINIKQDSMVRKLSKYHKSPISSISLAWDGKYLMSADHSGVIKQTCVSTGKVIKDYGKLYTKQITKTVFGLWGYKSHWN